MKRIFLILTVIFSSISVYAQKKLPLPGCTVDLGELMFKKVDTSESRGVADNYYMWDNGTEILVKFMPGGSTSLRNRVMQNAKEWEQFANIKFRFVPDTARNTNLRVQLGKGMGHNSAVGTQSNFIPQSDQTINFDTLGFADVDYYLTKLEARGVKAPYNWDQVIAEMKTDPNHWNVTEMHRVVLHEFGHSLGLLHEQSFPGAIKWNKSDSVYQYYLETQGWNKAKVDFNVFEVNNQFYTNGTTYDPKSIMHYSIKPWQTTNGYTLQSSSELSPGDKALISALYPKGAKSSSLAVPKVDVSKFTKLDVKSNITRKGLAIYPSFDLKTNSKLGQVYFVARLVDENGYYIKTNSLLYNWGGTAATYIKVNLLPNSKVSYNKGKQNLELFLPFSQMPELNGKKIIVEFSVILDDVLNGQLDKLMYYSSSMPMSVNK